MKEKFNQNTQDKINNFISSFITIFPNVYKKDTIKELINKNLNFDIEFSSSLETEYYYNPFLKILTINNQKKEEENRILFKALLKVILTNKNKNNITTGFETISLSENYNFYINEIFLNMFSELYKDTFINENNNSTDKLNLTKQLYFVMGKENLVNYLLDPEQKLKKEYQKLQTLDKSLQELDHQLKTNISNGEIFLKIGEIENNILDLYDTNNKKEEDILKDLNALLKISQNPNLDKYYEMINSIKEKEVIKKYIPLKDIYNSIDLIKNNLLEETIKKEVLKDYIPLNLYKLKEIFHIKQAVFDSKISYLNNKSKYNSVILYTNYKIYKNILPLISKEELIPKDVKKISIKYNNYINYGVPIKNILSKNSKYSIEDENTYNAFIVEKGKEKFVVNFNEKDIYLYKRQRETDLLSKYDFASISNFIDENIEVYYNEDLEKNIFVKENTIINPNNKNTRIVLNEEINLFNNRMILK